MTVVLSGIRDCFLRLPPVLASHLRLQQVPGGPRSGPDAGTPRAGGIMGEQRVSPRPRHPVAMVTRLFPPPTVIRQGSPNNV